MYVEINDTRVYVATGGKAFDSTLPTVVFLHGSGMDHRCWALQTRWFAFHGFSVLAPDLPGHSLSGGEPLPDIESMASWLWQLLDQLGVENASLVGHSQGGLIALEAAALNPGRVSSLSMIACAAAIPVNDQLLALANDNQPAAVKAMLDWGFGSPYHAGLSALPGQAPIGIGSRIMNSNPLDVDLRACNAYASGSERAAALDVPALMIIARQDRMTPARAGRALADALPDLRSIVELDDAGHMLPIEAPRRCLAALKQFISSLCS